MSPARSMRFLQAAALAWVLAVVPLEAFAFELRPISRDFTPTGSGSTQSYVVENAEKVPVAINVTVVTRTMDIDGAESNESAEDDFLIYPPQFIVTPGGTQTIRVTWLGDPDPKRELSYRLVVEQLPIERLMPKAAPIAAASGAVTILKRYMGSLYVRPQDAKPDLIIESAKVERDASGQRRLVVHLLNRGTGHAVLKDQILSAADPSNQEVTLSPGALQLKSTVVLPVGKRRLVFPWPHAFEPTDLKLRSRPRS